MGDLEREERRRKRRNASAGQAVAARPPDDVDDSKRAFLLNAAAWTVGIAVFLLCWFSTAAWSRAAALLGPPFGFVSAVGLNLHLARRGVDAHNRPWLIGAIVFPDIALFNAATSDQTFLDGTDADVATVLLSTTLLIVACFLGWRARSALREVKSWRVMIAIACLLYYADGASKQLDVFLDATTPQLYRPTVQAKRADAGYLWTDHYVTIGPWGPNAAPDEITVSKALYDRVEKGERLCALLHGGHRGMRYYTIDACK